MTGSKRMMRVDELLRRELGTLCEELVAPHASAPVTITRVHCSPDLREACVFFSVLGNDEQRGQAMRLMLTARKEMQHELSRRVILKYTPRLSFREDRTAERADRVLAILDALQLPGADSGPRSQTGEQDE